ncbi:hypothetical protein BO94DRAFT_582919 [Aspergillus sclerotioniger CBS 115572]|uniref:Histone h1.3 n=1 Tax=Aspergillus sclerotioniger CBS 115572 TaxID=1450535 RepID=A0A317X4N7_9EURO|nr:hypothetical protein BO94DRAFT_582919 [Aspergillus sclerotioniger CBS 115572]PWY93536.1 hypothetical protein BO94DRAFT_582919 [Aspergillus sclerotioniger CBS 115572]
MSTPKSNKPEGLMGLSLAEARMILLGVLSSDDAGKVDFDKMALLGGYKNAPSASTLYRNAKRKLLSENAGNQDGTTSTPSKGPAATPKKTPAKRKKGKADEEDGEVATGASPAPPKPKRQKATGTPKTPRAGNKAVKTEDENSTLEPSTPIQMRAAVQKEAKSEVKAVKKEDSSDTDAYYDDLIKKEDDRSDTEELMDASQLSREFTAMEEGQADSKADSKSVSKDGSKDGPKNDSNE